MKRILSDSQDVKESDKIDKIFKTFRRSDKNLFSFLLVRLLAEVYDGKNLIDLIKNSRIWNESQDIQSFLRIQASFFSFSSKRFLSDSQEHWHVMSLFTHLYIYRNVGHYFIHLYLNNELQQQLISHKLRVKMNDDDINKL